CRLIATRHLPSCHLLPRRSGAGGDNTVIGGVRFAGATLSTDYAVFRETNIPGVMNACAPCFHVVIVRQFLCRPPLV
ncbi:MAG: hypothetical protein J0H75_12470, partial [Rhizobiales bacterium]|nr:hypothetical protein [Hyphomicrobiales bacterium]